MPSLSQSSGGQPGEYHVLAESNIPSVVTIPNLEPIFGRASAEVLIEFVSTDFAPFISHFPPLQAKITNHDGGSLLVTCTEPPTHEGSSSPVVIGILFNNRFPMQPPKVAILLQKNQFVIGGQTHPFIALNGAIRMHLLDCGANPASLFDILAAVKPLMTDVRDHSQGSHRESIGVSRSDLAGDSKVSIPKTYDTDSTSILNSKRGKDNIYLPASFDSAVSLSNQGVVNSNSRPSCHSDPMTVQPNSRSNITSKRSFNSTQSTKKPSSLARRNPLNDSRNDSDDVIISQSLLQAFVVQINNISERYIRTRGTCEMYLRITRDNIMNTDKRIDEIRRTQREAISMKNEMENYTSKVAEWLLFLLSKASELERGVSHKTMEFDDGFFLDYDGRDDKVKVRAANEMKFEDIQKNPTSPTLLTSPLGMLQTPPSNESTTPSLQKAPIDDDKYSTTNNNNQGLRTSLPTGTKHQLTVASDSEALQQLTLGVRSDIDQHCRPSSNHSDTLYRFLSTVKHHIASATVAQCVVPNGDLNTQALETLSEVQAYEDMLRVLEECLAKGHLDMDYYLKMVSSVARKAFMARVVYQRASDALQAKNSLSVLVHRYCTDKAADQSLVESVLCAQHYSFSKANAVLAEMHSNGCLRAA